MHRRRTTFSIASRPRDNTGAARSAAVAVVLAILAISQARALAADAPRPMQAPSDFKKLVADQRDAIKSLRVAYSCRITSDPAVEKAGRMAGVMTQTDDIFVFSGMKRYLETVARGTDSTGNPIAISRTSVFNGDDCRRRESKAVKIQKAKSAYTEINSFTNGLLWPMTDGERESCDREPLSCHFLPYFIDDADWELAPDRQVVSDTSCVVLRKRDGARTLFLDPERNWAMVRYEQKDPFAGLRRWVMEYSDFSEVLPSCWLPRHIRATHEVSDEKTNQFIGNMVVDVTVTELVVNAVTEDQFVLEPAPGETVIDDIKGVMYKHNPTDANTLDRSVEQASGASRFQAPARRATNWLIVVNVFAATVFAIWGVSRLIRKYRG